MPIKSLLYPFPGGVSLTLRRNLEPFCRLYLPLQVDGAWVVRASAIYHYLHPVGGLNCKLGVINLSVSFIQVLFCNLIPTAAQSGDNNLLYHSYKRAEQPISRWISGIVIPSYSSDNGSPANFLSVNQHPMQGC